ncbi:hypothetical protein DLAC_05593 [Tieghemostelium lacteum]|uniref:MACPF domain-containing protein n=1 Tax=Tieghemostelium lacteum TaxID=361077 RepID=A0A151ZGE8_TIELA|nr:hypothetical protein DLAC_05593 [Tieghemostelium lacteum]|eukprot:KYQ92989.1 hypothetical protein DLAC_05593 [Tieghemostelium lacteum]
MKALLIVIILSLFIIVNGQVYVNPSSPACETGCGTISTPYNNLKSAITNSKSNEITPIEILLSNGTYTGIDNKEILIDYPVILKPVTITTIVTFDCEGFGRLFLLKNVNLALLNSFIVNNCVGDSGSAISIQNSLVNLNSVTMNNCKSEKGTLQTVNSRVTLSQCIFNNNTARTNGAAIYSYKSTIEITDSLVMTNNKKVILENSIDTLYNNDIYSKDSTITFDNITSANWVIDCRGDSRVVHSITGRTLCSPKSYSIAKNTCNNNGVCDVVSENYFSCPSDCKSIYFNGFLRSECLDSQCVTSPQILASNITVFEKSDGKITGTLKGYFKIPYDIKLHFRILSKNLGFKLTVNRKKILDFYASTSSGQVNTLETSQYIISDVVNEFILEYTNMKNSAGGLDRVFSLEFSELDTKNYKPFDITFFSKNICGDGVYDIGEQSCKSDKESGMGRFDDAPVNVTMGTCGNGFCDEVPNECIVDCHRFITERCAPLTVRKGSLVPGISVESDTMGSLLSNQFIWRLPGYQHLAFGTDIVSGDQADLPIFYFGFCDGKDVNIIEDTFREAFFEYPKELSVVPLPKCAFTTTNEFHSNASDLQKSKSQSSSVEYEASAGAGNKIGGEASASFSRDKSVDQASSLKRSRSGRIIETSLECTSSQVRLNGYSFHPNFIQDMARETNVNGFLNLIRKYGTHYTLSAKLGGKLSQITVMDSSTEETMSSVEVSESATYSFAMSARSPTFQASGSYETTTTTNTAESKMQQFSSQSTRSTIIVIGGQSGSYGPTEGGVSTFGEFAKTIDLLPVPINQQLAPIRSIIPQEWKTSQGASIIDLWTQAEVLYYKLANSKKLDKPFTSSNYIFQWIPPTSTTFYTQSIPYSPVYIEREQDGILVERYNFAQAYNSRVKFTKCLTSTYTFVNTSFESRDCPVGSSPSTCNSTVTWPLYTCPFSTWINSEFVSSRLPTDSKWKITTSNTDLQNIIKSNTNYFLISNPYDGYYNIFKNNVSTLYYKPYTSKVLVLIPPIPFLYSKLVIRAMYTQYNIIIPYDAKNFARTIPLELNPAFAIQYPFDGFKQIYISIIPYNHQNPAVLVQQLYNFNQNPSLYNTFVYTQTNDLTKYSPSRKYTCFNVENEASIPGRNLLFYITYMNAFCFGTQPILK